MLRSQELVIFVLNTKFSLDFPRESLTELISGYQRRSFTQHTCLNILIENFDVTVPIWPWLFVEKAKSVFEFMDDNSLVPTVAVKVHFLFSTSRATHEWWASANQHCEIIITVSKNTNHWPKSLLSLSPSSIFLIFLPIVSLRPSPKTPNAFFLQICTRARPAL